jgi:hypothetical protein
MKMRICELTELEGRSSHGPISALMFSSQSVSDGMLALDMVGVATTAGDNGAVNIYLDDDLRYRCQAMRRMFVYDNQIFTNKKDVRKWLSKALKEIE